MKDKINRFIDWFESKFNFLVDIVALTGALFMVLLSIYMFISLLLGSDEMINVFQIIILPGVLGFFAIIMLFALRITRYITKSQN